MTSANFRDFLHDNRQYFKFLSELRNPNGYTIPSTWQHQTPWADEQSDTDGQTWTYSRSSQSVVRTGEKRGAERARPESSNWSFPSFSRSSKEQHNGSPVQPNNRTRTLRPRLPLWTCPLCILKRTREDGGRGVRWRRKKSDERPTRRTRDEKEGAQLCILLCCNFAGSLDWNWGIIMKNAKIRYVSFGTIHKGRPQNFRDFWPPPPPCPQFSAFPLTPLPSWTSFLSLTPPAG